MMINLENLKTLSRQNDAFIKEILEVYLNNTPKDIDQMGEAVLARDWQVIRYYAHKLKSSSFTIGFLEGHAKFQEIEQLVRSEDFSDKVDVLFDQAKSVCDACVVEVLQELKKYEEAS